jgi:hypothetical protein
MLCRMRERPAASMRRRVTTTSLGLMLLTATVVVGFGLTSMGGDAGEDLGFFGFLFAGLWLYWILGALIVARADGHIVGWLFAVAAAVMSLVFLGYALGALLEIGEPGHPMSAWLGLVSALLFPIALILLLPAVALTFPTGTLPGPRWRWPVGLVVGMAIVGTVAILIRPGPMSGDRPDNPVTPWLPAVTPNGLAILGALDAIGSLALLLGLGLGIAAIVVRFRRSRGEERQQLKWFLAAMAPAAVLLLLSISELGVVFPIINVLSAAALPVAGISVAIAILRYRLYDIDRIISRSISYGLITGFLVVVFLLVNLGLQWLLSSVTSGNSLAVAGSTLLAAALFSPVRSRVQRIVDRRFDRARYDGEQMASAFSERMRDATDLPTLVDDLHGTVQEAISPSRVSLWLRAGER